MTTECRFNLDANTQRPVRIVVPSADGARTAFGDAAARLITDALRDVGTEQSAVVTADPAYAVRHAPGRSSAAAVIALGSMANNAVIRTIYGRFQTLVDAWYPGVGGSVVQPVPRAGEAGVIIAGGSDAEGTLRAAELLAARIRSEGPRLVWRLDVTLGHAHHPLPEDRIDVLGTSASPVSTPSAALPEGPYTSGYRGGTPSMHLLRLGMFGPHADNFHLSRSSELGLRYLYSGNEADGARYRDTLFDEIESGVLDHLYHYKSLRMFQLWEILGPSPLFSGEERAAVDDALIGYLHHGSGVPSLRALDEAAGAPGIFDRHLGCEALNLIVGADYVHRLTGEPEWSRYRDTAERYFRGQHGTDVPYTGLTEGYSTYLEVYLDWLLNTHPKEIRTDPHVRIWAERVLGLCTNRGVILESVQSDPVRFPYVLLRKLSVLLNDGRYRFAADARHRVVASGLDRVVQFGAGQAWETQIEPTEPVDQTGITVFPANERLRNYRSPEIPPEHAFDRIVGRSGWEPEDEYWSVPGTIGMGKVLPHVGAMSCYERFGVPLLVSPLDGLRSEENSSWSYSRVSVYQHGRGNELIGAARLIDRWTGEGDETVRIRMESSVYTWVRTLSWQSGHGIELTDQVKLNDTAEATVAVTWRCAGLMQLGDNEAHRSFALPCGSTGVFSLRFSEEVELSRELRGDADLVRAGVHTARGRSEVTITTIVSATRASSPPTEAPAENAKRRRTVGTLMESVPAGTVTRPVTASATETGRTAVATAGGDLLVTTSEGRFEPFARGAGTDTQITALTFAGQGLVTGSQDGTVRRLDENGDEQWRCRIPFLEGRTFHPWWYLPAPTIGSLAFLDDPTGRRSYVIAGTGSSSVAMLDAVTGELLGHRLSPHGFPDLIRSDIDLCSGRARAYVAHRSLTCTSSVYRYEPALSSEPTVVYADAMDGETRSPAWDMSGAVDFAVCGPPSAVPGRMIVLRRGTYTQLSAYDHDSGRLIWCNDVGGVPIGLATIVDADEVSIIVCEHNGWLTRYDTNGEIRSTRRVPDQFGTVVQAHDRWFVTGTESVYEVGIERSVHQLSVRSLQIPGRLLCAAGESARVRLLAASQGELRWYPVQ